MRSLSNRLARWLHLEHWQLIMIYLIIYDVLAVNGAYFLALWLRFDFRFSEIDVQYLTAWKVFTPWYTVICLVVFWFLRLYRSIWRFASFSELTRVAASSVITAILHTASARSGISMSLNPAGSQRWMFLKLAGLSPSMRAPIRSILSGVQSPPS